MTAHDLELPTLETDRLCVRALSTGDARAVDAMFQSVGWSDPAASDAENLARRTRWLAWTNESYVHLAQLHQPPYGERGVELRSTGELVGLVGLVPSFAAFAELPSIGGDASRRSPEVGLFWLIGQPHQGNGFATEAARALADHALSVLRVGRLVATTERDNAPSIAVMRRLGMRIENTEHTAPDQLQVAGVLEP